MVGGADDSAGGDMVVLRDCPCDGDEVWAL